MVSKWVNMLICIYKWVEFHKISKIACCKPCQICYFMSHWKCLSVKTLLDLEYQINERVNDTRNKIRLGIKIGNSEDRNLEEKLKPSFFMSNTT